MAASRLARLREFVFPIYGAAELDRFWTLAGIYFCVILVLVTTREAKDALVVAECGAEAIAFLKVYACLLYTSPSPRDGLLSRMPSSA